MRDLAVERADALERDVLKKLARMYPAAFTPVLEKHAGTLDKLDQLMQSGATGRARVLMRRSGLIRDISAAIAGAGAEAVAMIRGEIDGVREADRLASED